MEPIAIIGLAGRFPGADDVSQYWSNLREGRESIAFFTPEDLLAAGLPADVVDDPNYVRAHPTLPGYADFDARLFGMTPREAELTDPQKRIFLEVAHSAV